MTKAPDWFIEQIALHFLKVALERRVRHDDVLAALAVEGRVPWPRKDVPRG